jgi:hypothetical protein
VALRRNPELAWQTIGDEAVVMSLPERTVVGLNATGAFVWSRVEECGEEELAGALAKRFSTTEDEARDDVRAFLSLLRERGLVIED